MTTDELVIWHANTEINITPDIGISDLWEQVICNDLFTPEGVNKSRELTLNIYFNFTKEEEHIPSVQDLYFKVSNHNYEVMEEIALREIVKENDVSILTQDELDDLINDAVSGYEDYIYSNLSYTNFGGLDGFLKQCLDENDLLYKTEISDLYEDRVDENTLSTLESKKRDKEYEIYFYHNDAQLPLFPKFCDKDGVFFDNNKMIVY